jgi:hypothetical protein
VLHGNRIAARVIERDGDQEENSEERDRHNRVAQYFALMSLCFTWLRHQGTFNGLSHIGVLDICSHWNLHRGPLLFVPL